MKIKPCVIVPIYNNHETIESVANRLEPLGLRILIVDDGCNQETRKVLKRLEQEQPQVAVRQRDQNGGKGAAMKTGILWARELGYSHGLQVDADGQHCLEDAPTFLQAAEAAPKALILGKPIFDATVPKARFYGRRLSVYLVQLETLSRAIADPLFGYRVYPLEPTAQLMVATTLGSRMDFDPEIAVRLYWQGLPVVNIPSPVHYPEHGLSHFRMIEDNLRITWMHTRLTLAMMIRLPRLIQRRWNT